MKQTCMGEGAGAADVYGRRGGKSRRASDMARGRSELGRQKRNNKFQRDYTYGGFSPPPGPSHVGFQKLLSVRVSSFFKFFRKNVFNEIYKETIATVDFAPFRDRLIRGRESPLP